MLLLSVGTVFIGTVGSSQTHELTGMIDSSSLCQVMMFSDGIFDVAHTCISVGLILR